jgi:signal transduction histidine kinase
VKTEPSVGFDDVIINYELLRRTARAPDYAAENSALVGLARTLAESPDQILQRLVETALSLCRAHTAGISLLDEKDGKEVFRWEALAGVFSDRIHATMPRNASPCGTTIDRNSTQLMYMAERIFPALTAQPPVVEALLIPFHVGSTPVGTVWIVAHDESRKFDREDERIVRTLAEFASASWQLWKARADTEAMARKEAERMVELSAEKHRLEAYIANREIVRQQLQGLNRDLTAKISQKTAELAAANAVLLESVEEAKDPDNQQLRLQNINLVSAGIAHDLNNILNIIQSYAMLIMRHPGQSPSVIENAEVIAATVTEGAKLAQQLVTAGLNSEIPLELGNVNDLLRDLTHLLKKTFAPSVEIILDLNPQIPRVSMNPGQLNRAILNLCNNARDAIVDRGKIIVHTRTVQGAVLRRRFPAAEGNSYVCISVSDTGTGMDDHTKDRIFESGFTTKRRNQGSGVGLLMVKSIVAEHHGLIEVTSDPGHGSIFTIYLPTPNTAI